MWGIEISISRRECECVPHSSITIYGWSHATNIIIIMCSAYISLPLHSSLVRVSRLSVHIVRYMRAYIFIFSCAWLTFYATYVHAYYIKSIIEGWKMRLWIINVIVYLFCCIRSAKFHLWIACTHFCCCYSSALANTLWECRLAIHNIDSTQMVVCI